MQAELLLLISDLKIRTEAWTVQWAVTSEAVKAGRVQGSRKAPQGAVAQVCLQAPLGAGQGPEADSPREVPEGTGPADTLVSAQGDPLDF